MAAGFLGLHMKVTLKDPLGYNITGIVQNVEAGSSLTLTDVFITATRERVAQMKIAASNIADVSEAAPRIAPTPPATFMAPQSEAVAAPVTTQPTSQPAFVDPAILSVGRRPTSGISSTLGPAPPSARGDNLAREHQVVPATHIDSRRMDQTPEQILLDSVRGLQLDPPATKVANGKPERGQRNNQQDKKAKSRGSRHARGHGGDRGGRHSREASTSAAANNAHGKGWRETPILESNSAFQPFKSLRHQKGRRALQDNGWASEDVTEEMGEFDFANNLAKFDKHTIFDQMRREDQIDDASRLVSHNRRVKPGTAGGKNLHPTENVLDMPSTAARNANFWNSEADVDVNEENKMSGKEGKNGQGSRRAESKNTQPRRSQSRKASGAVGGELLSRVNSSQHCQQPGLYICSSDRRLEVISTLQMLNLENIAANELGFGESLMAENAGRGIAEVAVLALNDPAMKVRFGLAVASSCSDASISGSTIVVLAGNNKSGIRALAAARHLRNKNLDAIVCLVGLERERDLLEDLRRQMQLYRNFGGKVLNKNDFFEHLRKSSVSGSPVSVSLVIDALLGLTISFEELRIGDQATVYELMEWANRNEAFVLSIDVPTGIDPTTGNIAIIDGSQLYVKPRYVVSIGAPKRGLLEAVTPPRFDDEPGGGSNAAQEDEWRLFIADMGLGSAVWRKAGTKVRRGIDFDGKWVLEMEYRGDKEEDMDY
ncbi:hypothetical protein CDD81_1651 [Ophiocordyceps australis]|uniref:Enhancer of mRNA-decapping protein 3 n=1 Tax=Ophiocordyceps australis TaxID=1399860 RepID=A0A2C5X7Z2_9HYPO|nr:hypothetical protein CDD81_1651 [Ophiocordyceps australis]